MFQFTHPGGVRRAVVTTSEISICVSIHAPGRGATFGRVDDTLYLSVVSIHAPGRGATAVHPYYQASKTFQFTHPGGVRLILRLIQPLRLLSFNSRTREGCDSEEIKESSNNGGFNSRTREGCDALFVHKRNRSISSFNSRTREGCDIGEHEAKVFV